MHQTWVGYTTMGVDHFLDQRQQEIYSGAIPFEAIYSRNMKYNGRPSFHSDGMHTLPCMRCKDQLVQKKTQKKHNTKIEIEIHHETQKGKKTKKNKKGKKVASVRFMFLSAVLLPSRFPNASSLMALLV